MTQAECCWIRQRLDNLRNVSILDIGGGSHYTRLRAQPWVGYELYRPLLSQWNRLYVLERKLIQRKKDIWFSVGIEILSQMAAPFPWLRNSLSSFLPLATTIIGNCERLSLPDKSFDVIFLLSVLEHVTNPLQVLCEAIRILKEGGIAFISIPEICPYHPAPIDNNLRMTLGELTHFVNGRLTVLEGDSVSDEPSTRVSILYCRKN